MGTLQRAGDLFERIVSRQNLRLAFAKALRGKRRRREALCFGACLEQNLTNMAEGLRAGAFPIGRFHQFVIRDPKERVITAPCFAERVLHHAVMNVCEPVFERWLIDDTYACRVGRGRIAALDRARLFSRRFPFFLKLDVRKYFDSVCHETLLERLRRLFKDDRILDLFSQIVHGFRPRLGRGLPIGSLTSQHFANFYLGWFDRFAKEALRVKGYVRYMDDMLLWGRSSEEMAKLLGECREWLGANLSLELKRVPYINRTAHGADYLGCRVLPGRLLLNRRSRVRFRRKLMMLEACFLAGEIDERELQARATALVAFTRAGSVDSWRFRRAVVEKLPVGGLRPGTG